MKSNFKFKKALFCVALSLVLAFANVLAFNSFGSKNYENQIFAASDCEYCYGSVNIEPIVLNSAVDLSGKVYCTYCCYKDGTKALSSIDELLFVPSNPTYCWWPDKFTYILSSDGTKATVRFTGKLYNKVTYKSENIVKEFSITI